MTYSWAMNETLYLILAAMLMLPGLIGIVIPALPGVPFMFLIALGYALLTGFAALTGTELAILGGVMLATIVVDYLAGTLGARFGGASVRSMLMGVIGMIIGLFVIPGLGAIIGLFVGIFLSEYLRHRNRDKAVRAATGGLIGSLVGITVNIALAIIFLGLFISYSL